MRIMKSWNVILWLALLLPAAALGSVSVSSGRHSGAEKALLEINITGDITKEDATVVSQEADEMQKRYGKNWGILAKLDSTGGSVRAALQIGRILRKGRAIALISEGSVCMSSCVYVLAGASSRNVGGRVGIHRPYEPDGKEISESAQRAKYKKLGAEIKTYLEKMNIPTKLYDDSLFISPENVKILSPDEMQVYGLNADDPYWDEALSTKMAKKLGISRKEYGTRVVKSKQDCQWDENAIPQYLQCQEAIMNGKK